jgi:hypothetical protein
VQSKNSQAPFRATRFAEKIWKKSLHFIHASNKPGQITGGLANGREQGIGDVGTASVARYRINASTV